MTKGVRRVLWAVLAFSALGAAACERHDRVETANRPSSTDPARHVEGTRIGGGPTDLEAPGRSSVGRALNKLARVRCDREERCANVGVGQKYETYDQCVRKVRNDKSDDLNRTECPGGIKQRELSDCLDAIRTESCSNPLEALSRLAACRSGVMCID
jgi:hypothetical protein